MCSMIAKAIVFQKRKFESNNSKILGMSFVNIPSKRDSNRKTDGKSMRVALRVHTTYIHEDEQIHHIYLMWLSFEITCHCCVYILYVEVL